MFSEALYYFAALLLIAVLITIHEFGHFIVARAMGVQVKVFSIGFGKRLIGWEHQGTDYRISAFPFGGYVRMAGADPFMEGGADEDENNPPGTSFMEKPAWKRLLIVLAGPIFNLILPVVVFSALFIWGEPQPVAEVGIVRTGSVAEQLGVQPEDRIVSVEGNSVESWLDVMERFSQAEGPNVELQLSRDGTTLDVALPLSSTDAALGAEPYSFGLANNAPDTTLAVDDPASPAARAGLQTGDQLASVNGTPVTNWNEVRRLALTTAQATLGFTRDDGSTGTVTLQPDPAWTPQLLDADDALYQRYGLASALVTVGELSPGSAAENGGLKPGDRLLEMDGKPILVWYDVMQAVSGTATGEGETQTARQMRIQVRRSGQVMAFDLTPQVVRDTDAMGRYRWRALLGVGPAGGMAEPDKISRSYAPHRAVERAVTETTLVSGHIVEQLGKLMTGEAAIEKSLGGPVEIFRQTSAAARRGLFEWAQQLGLFSISLGIINLLPVPVLDGGQAVMYLAEWLRGRPLPLILRERAQQAGVIFLVFLMLLVLVFDLRRTFLE